MLQSDKLNGLSGPVDLIKIQGFGSAGAQSWIEPSDGLALTRDLHLSATRKWSCSAANGLSGVGFEASDMGLGAFVTKPVYERFLGFTTGLDSVQP